MISSSLRLFQSCFGHSEEAIFPKPSNAPCLLQCSGPSSTCIFLWLVFGMLVCVHDTKFVLAPHTPQTKFLLPKSCAQLTVLRWQEYVDFIKTGIVEGRLTVRGPRHILDFAKAIVRRWEWLDWHCFSAEKSIVANLNKAKEESIQRQQEFFWQGQFGRKLAKIPLLASLQTIHSANVKDQMHKKHEEILDTCLKKVRAEAQEQMENPHDNWRDKAGHWQVMLSDCTEQVLLLRRHDADVLGSCAEQFVKEKVRELRDSVTWKLRDKIREEGAKMSPQTTKALETRYETIAAQFEENANRLLQDFHKAPSHQALFDMMKCFNAHWSVANIFLPIYAESSAIIRDFRSADVLVVECDTGSGKSTALPALLQAELGVKVCISQPRILPCQRTAKFVADQMRGSCKVSYETADKACEPGSDIVYQTDGLLSARLIGPEAAATNPFGVICLDEVHERNKNLDLALMALARMLRDGKASGNQRVPKLVVMSATLDPKTLLPFQNTGLTVKRFQIKVPSPYKILDSNAYVGMHYMQAVEDLFKKKLPEEQILCFVPGTADVEKACASFTARIGCAAEPLHAQRDSQDMQAALERGAVFFATNIAETSITIPRLAYVVDVGKQNVASSTNQIFQLKECYSARSTLRQRRGRCGRVRDGTYFPTYRGTWDLGTGLSPQLAKQRGHDITLDFALPELLTGCAVDVEFRLWCYTASPTAFQSKLQELQDDLPIDTRDKEDSDSGWEYSSSILLVYGSSLSSTSKLFLLLWR